MQVRVLSPGRAARRRAGADFRVRVTIRDESLPLPLRIYFVDLVDDETGERELRNVGAEFGEELRDGETAEQAPELTALTLRRVVERYPHWVDFARAAASMDLDAPRGELERQVKRVKPARLDLDWYRMIASEYRRHVDDGEPAPVTAIARSHGVTPSAASRWVKTARERELLDG